MKVGLKWVHMAPYGLVLKLDGALSFRIISGPHLTQIMFMNGLKTKTNLMKFFQKRLPKSTTMQDCVAHLELD